MSQCEAISEEKKTSKHVKHLVFRNRIFVERSSGVVTYLPVITHFMQPLMVVVVVIWCYVPHKSKSASRDAINMDFFAMDNENWLGITNI